MTKTDLMDFAKEQYRNAYEENNLYWCSASFTVGTYWALKSYNTIVAIYDTTTGTYYVFDSYSRTTIQHVHKFRKILERTFPKVTTCYLYKRKDRIVLNPLSPFPSKSINALIENDWADIITIH